jgi:hypothetical protein
LQDVGKGIALFWAIQVGLLEYGLVVRDGCEEVVVRAVQHRHCTLIVREASNTFTCGMVSLWSETSAEKSVAQGGVDNVSSQVKLRYWMVQRYVYLLVLFEAIFDRVYVEQHVGRLAQDSRDIGQHLHALHMLHHLARRGDDNVAKEGEDMDCIDNF